MVRGVPDDVGWQLPEGMNARAYFNHFVYRGALQEDGFGNVSCPVPHFRRYMAEPGQPRFGM